MISNCAQSFQDAIKDLAAKNRKTPELVYDLWKKYCVICTNYDQSPLLGEFERWYQGELSA